MRCAVYDCLSLPTVVAGRVFSSMWYYTKNCISSAPTFFSTSRRLAHPAATENALNSMKSLGRKISRTAFSTTEQLVSAAFCPVRSVGIYMLVPGNVWISSRSRVRQGGLCNCMQLTRLGRSFFASSILSPIFIYGVYFIQLIFSKNNRLNTKSKLGIDLGTPTRRVFFFRVWAFCFSLEAFLIITTIIAGSIDGRAIIICTSNIGRNTAS